MIKKSVAALVTTAALASIALPTMALETSSSFDADYVLNELQAQGVNATGVQEWGTLVRAFVTTADGRQIMQYFEPVTLKPANI